MLFFKNCRLAPIRIPDTATEETSNPNLNTNTNPNPNLNDLMNIISHEHNDPNKHNVPMGMLFRTGSSSPCSY